MPYLTWDDHTMSVHVGVLDDDHRILVSMINDLFGSLQDGRDKQAIVAILDKLVARTIEHFSLEESYFAKTEYPEASPHMIAHAEMTELVLTYQQECKSGNPDAFMAEKANFLWNWLVNHDLTLDKKYGPYLNSKGVL
ncbi:MAG: bacteriohemerythrin [Bdellovibrionales bacterium]|jgi:hemerythrin-like metal-binding protein